MATTATAVKVQFVPCSDECMFAKGTECDCQCQGHNHMVGTNGLIPAEYMQVTRTVAGRLINPTFHSAKQQETAEWMLALHDSGVTKRDIAKQAGTSQATVRRYITRLLLAEEQDSE
jgi:hypothetical protein